MGAGAFTGELDSLYFERANMSVCPIYTGDVFHIRTIQRVVMTMLLQPSEQRNVITIVCYACLQEPLGGSLAGLRGVVRARRLSFLEQWREIYILVKRNTLVFCLFVCVTYFGKTNENCPSSTTLPLAK